MLVLESTSGDTEAQRGSLQGVPNKEGSSPRIVTSRRRIVYKKSTWNIRGFEVRSGELEWRVVVLSMDKSLLIWLGKNEDAELGDISLGVPAVQARGALATPLLGAADGAAARRLAAAARCAVYVCSGLPHDRFSTPLIERALARVRTELGIVVAK